MSSGHRSLEAPLIHVSSMQSLVVRTYRFRISEPGARWVYVLWQSPHSHPQDTYTSYLFTDSQSRPVCWEDWKHYLKWIAIWFSYQLGLLLGLFLFINKHIIISYHLWKSLNPFQLHTLAEDFPFQVECNLCPTRSSSRPFFFMKPSLTDSPNVVSFLSSVISSTSSNLRIKVK